MVPHPAIQQTQLFFFCCNNTTNTQLKFKLWEVEREPLYLWEIYAPQHCSRSDRKKRGWEGHKEKQVYYFGALKVNSMQHAHDATAGNRRVTTSFEVFPPIKEKDRLSAAKPCTLIVFKVIHRQNKDNRGTRCTALSCLLIRQVLFISSFIQSENLI